MPVEARPEVVERLAERVTRLADEPHFSGPEHRCDTCEFFIEAAPELARAVTTLAEALRDIRKLAVYAQGDAEIIARIDTALTPKEKR